MSMTPDSPPLPQKLTLLNYKIRITVRARDVGYQADIDLPDGRDVHSVAATPKQAILQAVEYWVDHTPEMDDDA